MGPLVELPDPESEHEHPAAAHRVLASDPKVISSARRTSSAPPLTLVRLLPSLQAAGSMLPVIIPVTGTAPLFELSDPASSLPTAAAHHVPASDSKVISSARRTSSSLLLPLLSP